jgi:ribosomal protein S18 acetylase RimI-like enzyme
MIEFNTLENINFHQLTKVFNLAFSDYIIKIELSEKQLIKKLENEGGSLKQSVGSFENGELIGFILHSKYKNKIYNSGTGVIPQKRGNGLTRKMYEFYLKNNSSKINNICLEVICENEVAKSNYTKLGFVKKRELNCYKVNCSITKIHNLYEFSEVKISNTLWELFREFWDIIPSWQNSIHSLSKSRQKCIVALIDNKIVGYCIFSKTHQKIYQIAVDKKNRNKGIGTSLINEVNKAIKSEVSIINVDASNKNTNDFLLNLGLKIFAKQFEMEMEIKKTTGNSV